jgi:hypothetical protein
VNKKVVANYAVESGPNSRFTGKWSDNGGGGMGGVWQSGMGLSTDGASRLFLGKRTSQEHISKRLIK